MELGIGWDDGRLCVVEMDGECTDEDCEVGVVGEEGYEGEVAGIGGEGEVAVEEAGGTRVEGGARPCGGSEGRAGGGEGREDGVEELDGEGSEGHVEREAYEDEAGAKEEGVWYYMYVQGLGRGWKKEKGRGRVAERRLYGRGHCQGKGKREEEGGI